LQICFGIFSHGKIWCYRNLVILAVVITFFGGKKIPELMKGLGSGIKEFKNAAKERVFI
jgi:sec-independent protein translocase protein TatA